MDVIRPCSRTHPDPHGGGEAELASPQLRQIVEEERSDDVVYVAVSKNSEKAASLLQWTFQYFEGRDVCILHVHQPSQLIPTPCKYSLSWKCKISDCLFSSFDFEIEVDFVCFVIKKIGF